jgi:two-component system chemotaxis sensor kinase CheA
MSDDDDELLQEFLVESYENVDRLESELLTFEKQGPNQESLAAVFRTVHTIKGTAGFFGFERLQRVMHAAENLLARLRDGAFALNPTMTTALLRLVDAGRAILASLEAKAGEGPNDYADLAALFDRLAAGEMSAPAVVQRGEPADDHAARTTADNTIRVNIDLLDRLMGLAGELVLARNQMLQITATANDAALTRTAQRMNLITSELQEAVMRTRMQPISSVWGKLPRVVRDLAGELGKSVRLDLEGEGTALDRSILEAIRDPLTHLVRNAVDHGIEKPDHRTEMGKPVEGSLRLTASHQGGHVSVQLRDDGGGIDPDRLKRKAIERQLITAESASRMTDAEAIQLIFAPGFSTAEKVTNVSGRGVGMDVVKTSIDKIGGVVEIESAIGIGTTVHIKIPLTLAIIPAMIVIAGNGRYAIPRSSVVEIVRSTSGLGIEYVYGNPVYRLRGALLPLVHLDRALGGAATTGSTIMFVETDGTQFGLIVDSVADTEEIVVKPIGAPLQHLITYAGATILGDGEVALILDVRGIAKQAGLRAATSVAPAASAPASVASTPQRNGFLVVQSRGGRRAALPLADIARLEEVAANAIEWAGAQEVVQYRQQMLPLVRLDRLLGYDESAAEQLTVVVYSHAGRDVGFVVDSIADVVDDAPAVEPTSQRHGILGCAILNGRVTELVDAGRLAEATRSAA